MHWNLNSNTQFNVLIKIILDNYLFNSTCIVYYHDDSHEQIQIKMAGVPIITNEYFIPHLLCLRADYYCNTFVLQRADAKEAFEAMEDAVWISDLIDEYGNGKFNERKYLIIVDSQDELANLFTSYYLTFVRDLLVILAPPDGSQYDLYTHKYIGPNCNNEPIFLDTWYIGNNSFEFGNILFPNKKSNQYGRELRATCFYLALCSRDPPMGSEYNIIVSYAEIFNFSLNILARDDFDYAMHPYYHYDWLMSNNDSYSDISFGELSRRVFIDAILTIAFTYEVSVPLTELKYGYFMFLEVFKWEVWMLTILTVISISCLVVLQRKYVPDSKFGSLALFGYLINQPSALNSDLGRSRLLKYILMLLLFFNTLLVTAYNSRLASVIVAPVYEKEINTLEELAQSDLKLLFFDDFYLSFSHDTREVYQTLYEKVEYLGEDSNSISDDSINITAMDEKLASGEYAVARFRHLSGEYGHTFEILDQIYSHHYKSIKPELFFDYYYIMLRRSSMHTIDLARIITTAIETGLMLFWEAYARRHDSSYLVRYQQIIQENPVATPLPILQLQHLKGIFALWGCGMVMGMVVFIKELLNICYFNAWL